MTGRSAHAERAGLAALGVVLLAATMTAWRFQPPVVAPPTTDGFSAARALAVLKRLLPEDRPHPRGSLEQAAFQGRLVRELQNLGLEPEVQTAHACSPLGPCGEVSNILVHLPGEVRETVLVSAHTDTAPGSPGASDDGHGVAVLVELARTLRDRRHRNAVTLLFTDGEEEGLLGALAFLEGHPVAARVAVAVNLEARGNTGISTLFRTAGEDAWLIDTYARHAPRPFTSSVHQVVFETMPHYTDLTAWDSFGIPGVDFAFIDGAGAYHSATDTVDRLDPRSVQSQGDNALAMVRGLVEADLLHPPRGFANWFDVMGLTVLHWPRAWTFRGCFGWAVLFGGVLLLAGRARRLRLRAVAGGALLASITLACSLLPGWAVLQIVGPHGLPASLTACLLAVGTVLTHAALGAGVRHHDTVGLQLGACVVTALGAVPVALFWPGVAHLIVLPGLLGAAGTLLELRRGSRSVPWGALFGLSAAAVLWFPMLEGIRVALGVDAGPLLTGGLGVVLLWGLPLWRALPLPGFRPVRRVVPVSGLGAP